MSTKECRICFEGGDQEDIISPCNCNGTSKYVHRACLDQWRSQDPTHDNFSRCNQCRFTYEMENPGATVTEADRKKKYKKAMKSSLYTFIISAICAIIVITVLIKALDYNGDVKKILGRNGHILLAIIITTIGSALFLGNAKIGLVLFYPFLIFGFSAETVILSIILSFGTASLQNGLEYIGSESIKNKSRIWLLQAAELERVKDLSIPI
jgi:hypothetical protein